MSILKVTRPYPFYFDQDGSPLDNGYVYIGVEDTDPIENPIEVFWDEDMCCAAPQPIRTLNGFAVNNGIQANLYVNSSYSIRVEDKAHVLISYIPNGWSTEGLEAANIANGVANSVGYQTASDIRALPIPVEPNLKVELYGPQGGVFIADLSDNTSAEAAGQGANAGRLIVSALGVRYKRQFTGPASPFWYGASSDTSIDSTAAVQACHNDNPDTLITGVLRIDGTITTRSGATIRGNNRTGQYYDGAPYDQFAASLERFEDGGLGPIIKLTQGSNVSGLFLKYRKSTSDGTGIVNVPGDQIVTYASLTNLHIMGYRTGDIAGTTTCYGIKLERNPSTNTVTFFNQFNDLFITDCDVGIYLGALCNANTFVNIQSRECHVHYHLQGDGAAASQRVIENSFSALVLTSISGTLSPDPLCFSLQYASGNIFTPYSTETYGREFDGASETGAYSNIFMGTSNEVSSWTNQENRRYPSTLNLGGKSETRMVQGTDVGRNVFGPGVSSNELFTITGDLPFQNNNAGTLILGDASNKVIAEFPSGLSKSSKKSFMGRIRLFGNGLYGNGCCILEVEFGYSKRSTASSAGEFSVYKVSKTGNEITGLYFITGASDDTVMKIAIACGNYGNFVMESIKGEIELTVFDFDTSISNFDTMRYLNSTTARDVTANDITDAITMLTIGNTAV